MIRRLLKRFVARLLDLRALAVLNIAIMIGNLLVGSLWAVLPAAGAAWAARSWLTERDRRAALEALRAERALWVAEARLRAAEFRSELARYDCSIN